MAPHKARRGRIRKCSSSFISSARRSLDTPPGLGRFASPPHVEALPPPPPAPRSGLFRCPWSVMTIMQACLLAKRFARHHAQRPQRSTAARGIWGWGGTGAAPLRRFSGRCAPARPARSGLVLVRGTGGIAKAEQSREGGEEGEGEKGGGERESFGERWWSDVSFYTGGAGHLAAGVAGWRQGLRVHGEPTNRCGRLCVRGVFAVSPRQTRVMRHHRAVCASSR